MTAEQPMLHPVTYAHMPVTQQRSPSVMFFAGNSRIDDDMTDKKQKKSKSWLIVYAAMAAAVIFATQSDAVESPDRNALSPVMIDGEAPLLRVDSIVRRADL